MSVTDFVWLSIGETLLAATFALGILVGISLTKRTSHDNSNEGTTESEEDYWRDVER